MDWGIICAAFAVIALVGTPAAAQGSDPVERQIALAAKLYKTLEYESALQALGRARSLSPDQGATARIFAYEGIIYAAMGGKSARERSIQAFKNGLRLDPKLALPLVVSPKVQVDFEVARRELAPGDDRPVARPGLSPKDSSSTPPTAEGETPGADPFGQLALHPVTMALGGVTIASAIGGAAFGLISNDSFRQSQVTHFADDKDRYYDSGVSSAGVANALFVCAGLSLAATVAVHLLVFND